MHRCIDYDTRLDLSSMTRVHMIIAIGPFNGLDVNDQSLSLLCLVNEPLHRFVVYHVYHDHWLSMTACQQAACDRPNTVVAVASGVAGFGLNYCCCLCCLLSAISLRQSTQQQRQQHNSSTAAQQHISIAAQQSITGKPDINSTPHT